MRPGIQHPSSLAARLAGGAALGVLILIGCSATAHAQTTDPTCRIDDAQRLLEASPRPDARIDAILDACRRAGSADWRVPLIDAVRARDAADFDRAVALLEDAERLAPGQANIRAELAYTLVLRADRAVKAGDDAAGEADLKRAAAADPSNSLAHVALGNVLERRERYAEAKDAYRAGLVADPQSRGGKLGMARILRSEQRWAEADRIYVDLLAQDPRDLEARSGRAFVAVGEYRLDDARRAFTELAAEAPDNQEIQLGLRNANAVERYQLDISTGYARTDDGEAWVGRLDFLANLDDRRQINLAYAANSRELAVPGMTFIGTPLPSHALHAGFIFTERDRYSFTLAYDLRIRDDLPEEHWLGADGTVYVADRLQLSGGFRQSFGDDIWDNRYVRVGLIADVAEDWQVAGSVWFEHYETGFQRDSVSYSLDVRHFAFRDGLFEFGAAWNPDFDNLNLHGRAVIPMHTGALLLTAEHNSLNDAFIATVGWRLRWR